MGHLHYTSFAQSPSRFLFLVRYVCLLFVVFSLLAAVLLCLLYNFLNFESVFAQVLIITCVQNITANVMAISVKDEKPVCV